MPFINPKALLLDPTTLSIELYNIQNNEVIAGSTFPLGSWGLQHLSWTLHGHCTVDARIRDTSGVVYWTGGFVREVFAGDTLNVQLSFEINGAPLGPIEAPPLPVRSKLDETPAVPKLTGRVVEI